MSSVAVYSTRSRATERTRNIRNDMNRASAYILSNDYTSPSSLSSTSYSNNNKYTTSTSSKVTRRPRDSSLGTLGRPNRDSSVTRVGTYTRDSSLPRYKDTHIALKPTVPTSLITSIISNRHSIALPTLDIGLGNETAKYRRQNEIKEIHSNFMKGFKETNDKISDDKIISEDQGERRTKSYAKIIGDQPNYMSEDMQKRYNYSEMFVETGKFSTRTLSAIKNLEGLEIRHKKRDPQDYQWRQDMEQFEKSSEYQRDKRIRNITNSSKNQTHAELNQDRENKENRRNISIQNRNRNALININSVEPSKKPPQSPKAKPKSNEAVKSDRPTRATKTVPEETLVEQPTPRVSWREKAAQKELEEKNQNKGKDEEEELKAKANAKAIRKKIESQIQETPVEPVKRPANSDEPKSDKIVGATPVDEKTQDGEEKIDETTTEEEEDPHGTKKMKRDFDAKMDALAEEMSAGKSKLSKLRERIRKAKATVKEADAALEDSKKS